MNQLLGWLPLTIHGHSMPSYVDAQAKFTFVYNARGLPELAVFLFLSWELCWGEDLSVSCHLIPDNVHAPLSPLLINAVYCVCLTLSGRIPEKIPVTWSTEELYSQLSQ